MRKRERKAEKKAREERKLTKKRLLELKPIGYHLKRTRDACNRYIRLRDAGKPCICCGESTAGKDIDAGHYMSVGSANDMRRFDPDNIHAQIRGHNRGRTQVPRERFRAHMIERIGLERVLRLEGPWPVVKWTREGLDELRMKFVAMARAITSGTDPQP